jgi:hypothetical protein
VLRLTSFADIGLPSPPIVIASETPECTRFSLLIFQSNRRCLAYRIELPSKHSLLLHSFFHYLSKAMYYISESGGAGNVFGVGPTMHTVLQKSALYYGQEIREVVQTCTDCLPTTRYLSWHMSMSKAQDKAIPRLTHPT